MAPGDAQRLSQAPGCRTHDGTKEEGGRKEGRKWENMTGGWGGVAQIQVRARAGSLAVGARARDAPDAL